MLILFAVTGAFQVFGLHADSASLFGKLAAVHSLQSFGKDHISVPLKFLVFLMGLSVVSTSVLGVMMAFRFGGDRKMVWSCLAFGLLLPAILLLIEFLKR